jgi:hypothetical protein
MKYIGLFCVGLLSSLAGFGQKLIVNDIPNGNYQSYEVGDDISFLLTGDSTSYKGTITSFQKNGFTLNDTFPVQLPQIIALTKSGGGTYGVGRVLLIVLGSYMILSGSIYTIAGLAVATETGYAPLGAVIAVVGAGIGVGGYAIINSQVKRAKQRSVVSKNIDNVNYKIFIE